MTRDRSTSGMAVGATAPAGRRRGEAGVTLVELAIAMSVLAILMTLGVPFLKRWQEYIDLRNAATGLAQTMLEARSRAIVERRTYSVSVDYAAERYAVAPAGAAPAAVGSVDFYADASDPDCPSLSAQQVEFRANGTADAAGFEAVYLKSTDPKIAARYRVKVLGATGKATVDKWLGGEWGNAF